MICFAIIDLKEPILVERCVLGIEVPALIGPHSLTLFTPTLGTAGPEVCDNLKYCTDSDFLSRLEPPRSSGSFMTHPEKMDWGEIMSASPNGGLSAEVNKLLAVFDLPEDEASFITNEIHQLNDEWLERLDSFLRLNSGQRTTSVTRVTGACNSHFLIYRTEPTKHLQRAGPRITLNINIHARGESATREQFEEVVGMCSEGKVVPLQYELLLRAHDAHQDGDARNAVIEASTALEVAATRRIRVDLRAANVSEHHIDLMLKGHQTLRNRVALLKKLGTNISIGNRAFASDVLDIRNKVIHGGHRVTDAEATKLVVIADKLVKEITPDFAVIPDP